MIGRLVRFQPGFGLWPFLAVMSAVIIALPAWNRSLSMAVFIVWIFAPTYVYGRTARWPSDPPDEFARAWPLPAGAQDRARVAAMFWLLATPIVSASLVALLVEGPARLVSAPAWFGLALAASACTVVGRASRWRVVAMFTVMAGGGIALSGMEVARSSLTTFVLVGVGAAGLAGLLFALHRPRALLDVANAKPSRSDGPATPTVARLAFRQARTPLAGFMQAAFLLICVSSAYTGDLVTAFVFATVVTVTAPAHWSPVLPMLLVLPVSRRRILAWVVLPSLAVAVGGAAIVQAIYAGGVERFAVAPGLVACAVAGSLGGVTSLRARALRYRALGALAGVAAGGTTVALMFWTPMRAALGRIGVQLGGLLGGHTASALTVVGIVALGLLVLRYFVDRFEPGVVTTSGSRFVEL